MYVPIPTEVIRVGTVLAGQPANQYPKITTNPNGQIMVSQGQTTLDKSIAAILQGIALFRNAPYIPTTQQPQQNGGYDAATLALLQQQALLSQQTASNTGGQLGASLQDFVSKNSTVLLVAGVALVLFKSGRK